MNIPREDPVTSLLNSYLDLIFDVFKSADNSKFVKGCDIGCVILGSTALFNKYLSTTTSGKHVEVFSNAHKISSIYKLINSAKITDDLSICFDRDRNKRQRELNDNKKINGKHHVRIMLQDIFGFAEHQKEATFGLG